MSAVLGARWQISCGLAAVDYLMRMRSISASMIEKSLATWLNSTWKPLKNLECHSFNFGQQQVATIHLYNKTFYYLREITA